MIELSKALDAFDALAAVPWRGIAAQARMRQSAGARPAAVLDGALAIVGDFWPRAMPIDQLSDLLAELKERGIIEE